MVGISFQFHGTREEVAPLLASHLHEHGLVATILNARPGSDQQWDGDIVTLFEQPDSDVTLAWTVGAPRGGAGGLYGFMKSNPDAMIVVLGSFTSRGLTQSWLSLKSEDRILASAAKALKRKIVRITEVGAIAENPVTGATASMPSYRYTPAARAAYDAGTAILPAAGRILIRLGSSGE